MHGPSFKDKNFVRTLAMRARKLLKLRITINTRLIRLKTILYNS